MKLLNQKVKRVRPLLGTYVEIELRGMAPAEVLHAWITEGFAAVAEIDRLMSVHRPDSDISRLNRAKPGEWVAVNPLTLKVLKASHALWHLSKGVFDIRCATPSPLMGEGWDGGERRPPTFILPHKGGGYACKTGPWTLDLGGIAKGFAVDCAVEVLQRLSQGRRISGVVNAGGDLRRWGRRLPAIAVATSAVRRSKNAGRFSRALHVRMPSGKILREEKAVSVLTTRCLWSDALTKVALLAPPSIVRSCLSAFRAHAVVFGSSGPAEFFP
jgi:thiamine biosynthesis lipoprotein